MSYQNILVPLDGSMIARSAIAEAVKLAAPSKGRILLLSVVEMPPMQMEGYGEVLGTLDIQERLRAKYEALLSAEAEGLRKTGHRADTLIREGLAHEEIVAVCGEEGIDVVVMTTHGRTGIAHWIMGSVAERVVRSAPCPVLIVRTRPEEGEKT